MKSLPVQDLSGSLSRDLSLDWLRGIAALLVLLTHVRSGLFVSWPELDPTSHTVVNHALFFVTRLGRDAVTVFFVLSGYLVGGQAVMEARSRQFSLHHYMVARATRLYTVLIPALLLTATVDMVGGNGGSGDDGWRSFFVNLFFLQEIVGRHYGSNGALWSLSYEWWFYVLFGLSVFAFPRQRVALRSAGGGLVVLLLLVLLLLCPAILWSLPLWLGGVVIRTISAPAVRVRWPLVSLSLALLLASTRRADLLGEYLVGAGAMLLIWLLRGVAPIRTRWLAIAGHTLASFSFTLYAVHQPLNALVDRLLVPHQLTRVGLTEWISLLVLAAGLASCAFACYWLFERNTPRIRRWLMSAGLSHAAV
jgi:peptidoglycan/LPS O-acetylase OafA/YrhL